MALQHQQWIPIDSVITDYLTESEQSNHKYFKLFHSAFRGMDNMGIDFFYTIQSFKLPVNANLTATIPANCIKVSKVGVFNQQGEVIPLSQNSNLSTAFDLQPTRLEQTQDNTIPTQISQNGIYWYNYWNGSGYTNLYGLPSGSPFVGNYKIDNANGVIVLSQNFAYDYVLVECVTSPVEGETYYIPVQFREALIAWLRWKDNISIPVKTHVSNSNIQMRRHDFYNERRLAIAQYDPVNLPDLYEWNLKTMRLTVKA